MSKHRCIHCNGIVENEELSYCESCCNKLRTKGMFSESKKYFCGVCGRELTEGDNIKRKLCNKHYQQIKKYGFTLEDNRRTEIDLNEYEEYPKHFEMKLYDEFQEELEDKVLIDKDDYELIKDIRWDKNASCVTAKINGKIVPLQNYILNTNEKINFVSQDILDCRRNNLYIKKKKDKKHKHYDISKKNKDKIIIDFAGSSKTQVTGSAIIVSYPVGDNKYERLLVEFGQSQGNGSLYDEYKANKGVVDDVLSRIDNLQACFILHTHL